jgi:hypothetical protein
VSVHLAAERRDVVPSGHMSDRRLGGPIHDGTQEPSPVGLYPRL